MRVLHLAENLRLADDQRVEAGGDAKQVPRGFEVGELVDVRRAETARSMPWNSLKNVASSARAAVDVVARDVQLGAVAGRDHRHFAGRTAGRERPQRAFEAARLEVEPLAQLDRRGAMTDSD